MAYRSVKAICTGAAYLAVTVLTLAYLVNAAAAQYAAGIGVTVTP